MVHARPTRVLASAPVVVLAFVFGVVLGCGRSSSAIDDLGATDVTAGDALDALDAATDTFVTPDGLVLPDAAEVDAAGDLPGDTGPKGDLGTPCVANTDCASGYCLEGFEGAVCTVLCVDSCPAGYSCRVILDTFPDVVSLCVPDVMKLCAPCQADSQCFGGRCVALDGGRYCASDCSGGACPASYTCTSLAVDEGGGPADVCLPASGACDCRAGKEGQLRSCSVATDQGTCWGFEACGGDAGWQGCNAATPLDESCDGVDNDCDGLVDEGHEPKPCSRYVEGVGTCSGDEVCAGQAGWVCSARLPAPEACNYVDDDCDGATDEDFKTGDAYTADANCGACGVDCAGAILNAATVHCDGLRELPACVVDACEPPYFRLNEFQCILPPDTYCKPCEDDAECYGGACLPLGDTRACFLPCEGDGDCADHPASACAPLDGLTVCLPVNGTCDCDAASAGSRRACSRTNDVGTCLGFSTCSPADGWGPCDAREPAPEACNGVDDDCNGLQDDALAPVACEATVEGVGTCAGTSTCFGAAGWVCSAPQPAVEACNLRDDDCDGATDEDFRTPDGLYGLFEHCGACNASCAGVIVNGSARCDATGGVARCVVDACDPGHYRFGDTACVKATDTSCKPCAVDADCVVPGDRCLASDDGAYCGLDCGPGNLHLLEPGTCPAGYACQADAAPLAGAHCHPVTQSCTCTPDTPGLTRVCSTVNAHGTCFGLRTCDTAAGWSACDAATPAAEVCNGADDDCNGTVDDLPGIGAACARTVEGVGTCLGTRVCTAQGPDLACSAKQPAPEACNYADDDCDGASDETWPELYASCSDGAGACKVYGYVLCRGDGTGATCSAQAAAPGVEVCNGVDDDCDGATDEDAPWADKNSVCTVGTGICRAAGIKVCDAATPAGPTVCSAAPGLEGVEACNGQDDDCDGATDEDWPTKGTPCTAGEGLCASAGVWVCDPADPAFVRCNATPGQPAAAELCNLVDDTCDGTTDEDFVDANGRYVRDTACGNCFTDCTVIYDLPAAYGECDVGLAVPACRLRCDPGAFDLNGIPDDGCEFALDPAAIYVSVGDPHADDLAGCGRGPWGTGADQRPCRSIARGTLEVAAAGRSKLLVADGQYAAAVTLADGVALLGGYRADTWERHLASTLTVLRAPVTTGAVTTVSAVGLTKPTLLEGFVIQGQAAVTPGASSYALYVADCGAALTVRANVLQGGTGAAGQPGARGEDGWQGQPGYEGEYDIETTTWTLSACLALSVRPGNQGYEGGGGWLYCGDDDVGGGDGAGADCPNNYTRQAAGKDGKAADTGPGAAGVGGNGGYDRKSTNCSQFTTNGLTANGENGVNGMPGTNGTGGTGCQGAQAGGTVVGNAWVGVDGGAGGNGTPGGGGGGGGAGGGADVTINCTAAGVPEDTMGGSGGGGGSGGCQGEPGVGGTAGGAAFALFVTFTSPSASLPTITGNTLQRGYGGAGGGGGAGGAGGQGGQGAPGGFLLSYWAYALGLGGAGGDGGAAGHGGGGGGGCGGPSYALYVNQAATPPTWHTTNTFAGGGSGGAGGLGGPSVGEYGADGAPGVTADRNY